MIIFPISMQKYKFYLGLFLLIIKILVLKGISIIIQFLYLIIIRFRVIVTSILFMMILLLKTVYGFLHSLLSLGFISVGIYSLLTVFNVTRNNLSVSLSHQLSTQVSSFV